MSLTIGTTKLHRPRTLRWIRENWLAASAAALFVLAFAGAFGTLHTIHVAQNAVPEQGTVTSYTSREYTYKCGEVGGDPAKGIPGTPIMCDGTEYPSQVDVDGTTVAATLSSEPTVGGVTTLWHIDGKSWATTDPHSGTQLFIDLLVGLVAAVIAVAVVFIVAMVVDMILH